MTMCIIRYWLFHALKYGDTQICYLNVCALLLSFIRGLAEYEKMADQIVSSEKLLREWIFEKRKAEVLFVCDDDKEVGYALFFHNFMPCEPLLKAVRNPAGLGEQGYVPLMRNITYANLHRFLNKAGEPYSTIYVGTAERLSCESGHEQGIDYWNQE